MKNSKSTEKTKIHQSIALSMTILQSHPMGVLLWTYNTLWYQTSPENFEKFLSLFFSCILFVSRYRSVITHFPDSHRFSYVRMHRLRYWFVTFSTEGCKKKKNSALTQKICEFSENKIFWDCIDIEGDDSPHHDY